MSLDTAAKLAVKLSGSERGRLLVYGLLLGAAAGLISGWFVFYPLISQSLDTIKSSKIAEFEGLNSELKKNIDELKKRIDELEKSNLALREQLATRPLNTIFMQGFGYETELLPGLRIKVNGFPRVGNDGKFSIDLEGKILRSPYTTIDSNEPYEFQWDGKIYHFVAMAAKPFYDNRVKLSLFSGPARRE